MKLRFVSVLHLLIFAVLLVLAYFSDGTGGGGDSLTHYFFAQNAWREPIQFLDNWAKPVFTLLASPWAQFGFKGIILFNITCGVAASWLATLAARQTGLRHYLWLPLLAFISPAYYSYLFSGLTEPLAGLLLMAAVYLGLRQKLIPAFIIVSFLPFVRTETQVMLPLFLLFGLAQKQWRSLPFLLTGYVVYGLVSWWVLGSPLSIYQHPYDASGSAYGSGPWWHYLQRLRDMLMWPGLVLLAMGALVYLFRSLAVRSFRHREAILILLPVLALVGAHSLVWALGIYGSAGLERTLITVFPLLWILMLQGLEFTGQILHKRLHLRPLASFALILALQAYITWQHPLTGYYWQAHLFETENNRFYRDEVAPYIRKNFPHTPHYIMSDPYLALPLGLNYKNSEHCSTWSRFRHPSQLPDSSLFLFDSYYVPVHDGVTAEMADEAPFLIPEKQWQTANGHQYRLYIYQAAPSGQIDG